ncbi:hypothetical protein NEF87_004945 [Candidatus Lokiarchaeum ossiferum]|uniref:Uncharacterized protein n=1 Tax=Candidatus Lokiarchaeum ossiferum TaxID=2951803 RepID=A0ABY6HYS7_9ARCH|nr:hypothetical protein NEF87_004945 [Candidatus Lokiarchaeum sp. B-35]
MSLIEKWKDIWAIKEEDLPREERIFKKGNILIIIIAFIISAGIGMGMLYLINRLEPMLSTFPDGMYQMNAWAASYFLYFFCMVIPIIVANIFYQKTKTPSYGFSSFAGFIVAAIMYYFIAPRFALYTIYSVSLAVLGNIPSQKDYKLKWYHMTFYFVLGIIACYFNMIYQVESYDVWVWLQFIHLHLFVVLIASVKIRQWSYMYMFGWAFMGLLFIIFPNFPIFGLVEPHNVISNQLIGVYNVFVPPLLVITILTYFFKIQRKTNIGYGKKLSKESP